LGARTGPVRDYEKLKVFACEGLVCIVDERKGQTEGEYTVVLPDELEHRVKALNRPYRGQGRMDLPKWKRREYDIQKQGSQNCLEAIKEARAMGDPSQPEVQLFWARHRRNSTIRITFSSGSDPAGYPELPHVPLGKFTGKTAAIDRELVPAINLQENHIHVPPQPKRKKLILLD
jgi:hypothetical protein